MPHTLHCRLWVMRLDQGLPGGSDGKESACKTRDPGFDPWVGNIPWRRAQQLTPVFLTREYHGQRSLAGCRGHGFDPWSGN